MEYKRSDLILNSDDQELGYRRRKDEEKTSLSWGQRKLLLVLLQFLNLYWDQTKVKNPKVIYAGAAPGINIKIVSELYPEVEFHLYDPAPFKIKPTSKIHLYNTYFTDKVAKKWAGRNDVYFISDIRTADYTLVSNLDKNEEQIMKDMNDQLNWYQIIKPVQGQLKFRLPYTGGNRPEKVDYLAGWIFKQPWAPQTTTETRLVPTSDQLVSWDCMKYQSQLFYHNTIIRESFKYNNFLNNQEEFVDKPELLNDWDSMTEAWILREYLTKRGGSSDSVPYLSRLLTKKLTKKSKFKDTLNILRTHPQLIKNRNFRPSRDTLGPAFQPIKPTLNPNEPPQPPNPPVVIDKPINNDSILAKEIGL